MDSREACSSGGKTGATGVALVTAADHAFWRCLYQFLLSVERRDVNRDCRCIAYDLGMLRSERALLEQRFPWCLFRTFRYEDHPPHVVPVRGTYAWKPIVIEEVVAEHDGIVFWFDSATLIRTSLDHPRATIGQGQVYVMKGQSPLSARCDPEVAEAMAVPRDDLARPILFAGAFGIDAGSEAVRRLISRWRALADDPAVFVAASPSHNADQTMLTILLYEAATRGEITLGDEEIDISSCRPIRWMSSRNKLPPEFPLWADPLARAYHVTYKFFDRLNLRYLRRGEEA